MSEKYDYSVEQIMTSAYQNAKQNRHEYVTLEHITLALFHNEKIISICKENDVDVNQIILDLNGYLDNSNYNNLKSTYGDKGDPKKTTGVDRVIQRGITQMLFSQKSEFSPEDLLVSILN